MNGNDAFESFCEAVLDEAGRVVAPMGLSKAQERLQAAIVDETTSAKRRMTVKAGAFLVQQSVRQVYVHKKGKQASKDGAPIWRSLWELLSHPQWTGLDELLVGISRRHGELSRNDLIRLLHFFLERGWLEKGEGERYRLAPAISSAIEGDDDRLGRAITAVQTVLAAADGLMLQRPDVELKVLHLKGSPEDLARLWAAQQQWLEIYMRENPPGEGGDFTLIFASAEAREKVGAKPRQKRREE